MSERKEVLVCSCCGKEVLCMECDVSEGNRELLERERKFVEWWNTFPGVSRSQYPLPGARRKMLRTRLREKRWQADAVKAKGKFPLACGWIPSVEDFLKPSSVLRILEGKYDWKKDDGSEGPILDDGFSQREKAREIEREKFR